MKKEIKTNLSKIESLLLEIKGLLSVEDINLVEDFSNKHFHNLLNYVESKEYSDKELVKLKSDSELAIRMLKLTKMIYNENNI